MIEPLIVGAVTLPAAELRWTAVRAGGPGGQNVNKVASKVELRWAMGASTALSAEQKHRLKALAGSRIADGELIITSQKTRDQAKNLADAREKLADFVRRALVRPTVRRPTRPSRARVRKRVDDKRKQGEKKTSRQRPTE